MSRDIPSILYVVCFDSGTGIARQGFRKFDPADVGNFLGDPLTDGVLQMFTTYTAIKGKHVLRLTMRLTVDRE